MLCKYKIFHKWSEYEPPKQVTGSDAGPVVAQRRYCIRCGAVDYRRVAVHN